MSRWEAQSRCGDEPSRVHTLQGQGQHAHLAIDGKTLRAPCAQPHPVQQLSCYEVSSGIVLWHCNGQEKEHEISALKPWLTPHLIKGRIFTLDAMPTRAPRGVRRSIGWRAIISWRPRTPNPLSMRILRICLSIAPPIVAAGNTLRPGRNGMEGWNTARLSCSPDLGDWFSKQWAGIEQVFRLERTVRLLKTNQTRHEVVYGREPPLAAASPSTTHALVGQRPLGQRE